MNQKPKAIVVGASSGIGRSVALALANAGWDVIVHGFHKALETQKLADEIQAMGQRSLPLLANLADSSQVNQLVEQAWNTWDGLDAWLHLAGADILTGSGRHAHFDEKLQMLWQVDVLSTITACRLAGRFMQSQGSGSIVTMGWDQAETGMEGDSGELFAATKGAVMAFTRSLSLSLAPLVRVNCIAPGWIKTAWGDHAPAIWQERVLRETPLSRWGLPEDIASACRFLVSPEASFLTGQTIRVNGGAIR
jgi:3-oxoacyl-[acyl-carrier protein] reductase